MKPHIEAFLNFWKLTIADLPDICCWYCNSNQQVQIMHIDQKGMGGRDSAEYPENYMPGCGECHRKGEGNAEWKVIFWNVLCERIRTLKRDHQWSDKFKITSYYQHKIKGQKEPLNGGRS
jgi:hypothetical protein